MLRVVNVPNVLEHLQVVDFRDLTSCRNIAEVVTKGLCGASQTSRRRRYKKQAQQGTPTQTCGRHTKIRQRTLVTV